MDYIELTCQVEAPSDYVDIIIARLAETGFEMFEETDTGVKAYIMAGEFDRDCLKEFDDLTGQGIKIAFSEKLIPSQNWNALWESNFEPVVISNRVYIRAHFHPEHAEYPYTIVIDPRMSFGTGHHATTSLMTEALLETDLRNRSVLDMGCGTGILAILAVMLGATNVKAVDNDEIAVANAIDNCALNGTDSIEVVQGDASSIESGKYDVILANINRNILLSAMKSLAGGLKHGGILVLSGFYESDTDALLQEAVKAGLKFREEHQKEKWACLLFNR